MKNQKAGKPIWPRLAFDAGLYATYLFFFILMAGIIGQYIPFGTDIAFLRIKQQYVDIPYYIPAFAIHTFTSMLCLLAGFTQFSKRIRSKFPSIHRTLGKVYIISVLALIAPSGFLIGLHANGGLLSQIAFCLLAVLWFYFTWMSYRRIKKGDYIGHRNFMIRSFALALSAITLRAWKYIIVFLFHPRPMDVYMIIAWLGWVLNLLIAELLILKLHKK